MKVILARLEHTGPWSDLLDFACIERDETFTLEEMLAFAPKDVRTRPLHEELFQALQGGEENSAAFALFKLRGTYLGCLTSAIRTITMAEIEEVEASAISKQPELKARLDYLKEKVQSSSREKSRKSGRVWIFPFFGLRKKKSPPQEDGSVLIMGPGLTQGATQENEYLARMKIVNAMAMNWKETERLKSLEKAAVAQGLLFQRHVDQQAILDRELRTRFPPSPSQISTDRNNDHEERGKQEVSRTATNPTPERRSNCPECNERVRIDFVRTIESKTEHFPPSRGSMTRTAYYHKNLYRIAEHGRRGIINRICSGSGRTIELKFDKKVRRVTPTHCEYCGKEYLPEGPKCPHCTAPTTWIERKGHLPSK